MFSVIYQAIFLDFQSKIRPSDLQMAIFESYNSQPNNKNLCEHLLNPVKSH